MYQGILLNSDVVDCFVDTISVAVEYRMVMVTVKSII